MTSGGTALPPPACSTISPTEKVVVALRGRFSPGGLAALADGATKLDDMTLVDVSSMGKSVLFMAGMIIQHGNDLLLGR